MKETISILVSVLAFSCISVIAELNPILVPEELSFGGGGTAVKTGIQSALNNPALLVGSAGDVNVSSMNLYPDVYNAVITAEIVTSSVFHLATSFQYLNFGSFFTPDGSLPFNSRTVVFSFSWTGIKFIDWGCNLKLENKRLLEGYNNNLKFDLGLYNEIALGGKTFSVGLSMKDFFSTQEEKMLMFEPKLGLAYEFFLGNKKVVLFNDVILTGSKNNFFDSFGGVFRLGKSFDLIVSNRVNFYQIFQPGFGFSFIVGSSSFPLRLSYSIVGINHSVLVHGLSLEFKFLHNNMQEDENGS